MSTPPPRRSLDPFIMLAIAASPACSLPFIVGDNPDDESTTPASTDATTSPDDPTTSTTAPAVCGDGLVAGSEICDDGNAERHDGCDEACARTGVLEWTFERHGSPTSEDAAFAVAIDSTGRIFVVGAQSDGTTLFALAPDGVELWKRSIPDFGTFTVSVDDAGRLYVGGTRASVHCLTVDGADVWAFSDLDVPVSEVYGFALADDALYAVGAEADADKIQRLVLRRHDLATGAAVWKTMTPPEFPAAWGQGVALSGSNIVAVGGGAAEKNMDQQMLLRALVTAFDADGKLFSIEWGESGREWRDVAPIGEGGDLVLIGFGPTADVVVRRIGFDRAEQWTHIDSDVPGTSGNAIAVGPDEAIVVAGHDSIPGSGLLSLVRRHTGDGDIVWTSLFENPIVHRLDDAADVAFGPGFIVAVGRETVSTELPDITKLWVRRFAGD